MLADAVGRQSGKVAPIDGTERELGRSRIGFSGDSLSADRAVARPDNAVIAVMPSAAALRRLRSSMLEPLRQIARIRLRGVLSVAMSGRS